MAIAIGDELDQQNALLGELEADVGATHSRMRAAQRKMQQLMRSQGGWAWTCTLFGLAVLLVLLIGVVWRLF